IELQARTDAPGARAFAVFKDCWEQGVLIRTTGDTIALSPPLIVSEAQIGQIVKAIKTALERLA
ncbi:MAG: aspartate aminotransferase family protein, partial [Inhella sp.]